MALTAAQLEADEAIVFSDWPNDSIVIDGNTYSGLIERNTPEGLTMLDSGYEQEGEIDFWILKPALNATFGSTAEGGFGSTTLTFGSSTTFIPPHLQRVKVGENWYQTRSITVERAYYILHLKRE